jgi:chromosome segregation ATPase
MSESPERVAQLLLSRLKVVTDDRDLCVRNMNDNAEKCDELEAQLQAAESQVETLVAALREIRDKEDAYAYKYMAREALREVGRE